MKKSLKNSRSKILNHSNMHDRTVHTSIKNKRFDARIPKSVKTHLAEATALSGASMVDLVIQAAHEKALAAISQHEQILSTEGDKLLFFSKVFGKPKPATGLMKAIKKHLKKDNLALAGDSTTLDHLVPPRGNHQ